MRSTKTKTIKMHVMITLVFITFLTSGIFAQDSTSTPTERVYQEWQQIGESEKMIDVSARVISCNGTNQVLLNVFNENTINQDASFNIKIKNADGNEISKDINFSVLKMQMNIAKCGDNTYDALKINFPNTFDAATVKVSIEYK